MILSILLSRELYQISRKVRTFLTNERILIDYKTSQTLGNNEYITIKP